MSDFSTDWNNKELSAYILLYCANANYSETEEQIEMIRAKVDAGDYKSIRKEFQKDNDFQSISKIKVAVERLGYSKTQIDALIDEIKSMFLVDGYFDQTEKT